MISPWKIRALVAEKDCRVSPTWRPGDQVRWQGRAGTFRRDAGDGEHAEILLGERIYRVRFRELG